MTEKLINDIYNILDNVYYWESCPQEYNDKIDIIKKELSTELKKLRVDDVSVCACGSTKYYSEQYKDVTKYYCSNCHEKIIKDVVIPQIKK